VGPRHSETRASRAKETGWLTDGARMSAPRRVVWAAQLRKVVHGPKAGLVSPCSIFGSFLFFPKFNLNSNFKFKLCAEFVLNYIVYLISVSLGNIKFIHVLYTLFSFFFFKSSSHYYFISFFIHIIIVLNAQTKIQYDEIAYLCL
jgi:hypothetical protein